MIHFFRLYQTSLNIVVVCLCIACVCIGNRTGAACERCKPGYAGDNCETQIQAVDRSDFRTLSEIDKQYVIDAFRLSKVVPHPYHT
jgi:hypothetical protein